MCIARRLPYCLLRCVNNQLSVKCRPLYQEIFEDGVTSNYSSLAVNPLTELRTISRITSARGNSLSNQDQVAITDCVRILIITNSWKPSSGLESHSHLEKIG